MFSRFSKATHTFSFSCSSLKKKEDNTQYKDQTKFLILLLMLLFPSICLWLVYTDYSCIWRKAREKSCVFPLPCKYLILRSNQAKYSMDTNCYQGNWRTTNNKSHLKEIVFSALSATALAFSISVAWRWKAMNCNQRMELSGLLRTKRSKSSAVCGCRLGSIKAASSLESSFSACCFSSSCFFFVCFLALKEERGERERPWPLENLSCCKITYCKAK